jgi:hypothetical protein
MCISYFCLQTLYLTRRVHRVFPGGSYLS